MANYDAIVDGAGPAGSACAYRLASAGASVSLLDRAHFPCDKHPGWVVYLWRRESWVGTAR